jgi:hypothetical protein
MGGAMRSRRRRWVVALAIAAVAAIAAWAALAPLPAVSRELVYVIPRGTAARAAAGLDPAVLPARIRLTLGIEDVLVLRNEDVVEQRFGPAMLAAGQSYRLPFHAPAEIPLSCSAHRDGQITIVVEGAPSRGPARLLWRVRRWLDA